jgi:hypothetical protein
LKAPTSPDLTKSQYSWQQFELAYPSSWKIDLENDENGTHTLRVAPTNASLKVLIVLGLSPSAPPPDQKYKEVPALAGLAFAYPSTAQAADNKGKGLLSYCEVQLGSGPAPATQISWPTKDGKLFISTLGFTLLRHGAMVGGILTTSGQVGQVNEDPAYHKAIAEAYGILRSLRIGKK